MISHRSPVLLLWFRVVLIGSLVMQDELETAMRNNGITSLEQATPDLVLTADIDHLVPASRSHPYARAVARRGRETKL